MRACPNACALLIALVSCRFLQVTRQDSGAFNGHYALRQIVATEHPIASQIGADILSQGGNAVDAAVAANAAMGVFAPMANVSAAIFSPSFTRPNPANSMA